MTEDKTLVERLRDDADRRYGSCDSLRSLEWEAADHIETQAAEIARLRDHLEDAKEIIQRMMKREDAQAADIARLRGRLRWVAEPIVVMQEQAKAAGETLDGGVAVHLSNNAEYLKSIARAALGEQP